MRAEYRLGCNFYDATGDRPQEPWRIGPVEIPTRLVLAPMAGVSVQAFRRQGRRYGAGLVCSEMVSCAGIEHRNERTLGYLRVAADEHPLAIQLFGSRAARARERGADGRGGRRGHRRPELRLPRAEGHADRRRRDAARGSRRSRAASSSRSPDAVDLPGHRQAAARPRERLARVPRARTATRRGGRVVAHAASPLGRSRCTPGTADHSLTAELVSLVDVPVVASGDVTSRARAQTVLATTGAAAVMVGRGAQGNPVGAAGDRRRRRRAPSREEVAAELVLFVRETVRELGERRASGFLKKFYGWYLGQGRFPEAVQAGAAPARLARGGRAPPVRGGAGRDRARSSGSRRRSRPGTR